MFSALVVCLIICQMRSFQQELDNLTMTVLPIGVFPILFKNVCFTNESEEFINWLFVAHVYNFDINCNTWIFVENYKFPITVSWTYNKNIFRCNFYFVLTFFFVIQNVSKLFLAIAISASRRWLFCRVKEKHKPLTN